MSKVKKNLDSRKRILNIISELEQARSGRLTNPPNMSSTVRGTSGIDLYVLKHTNLGDMPSSTNTDHDGRYRTETELASVANGEGASMIGIEDDGTYYTGTDVEAALQEIGSDLAGLSSPWTLTGTVRTTNPAGGTVELAQTSTTGNALRVERNLASGSTDNAVVSFKQLNAGDNRETLVIVHSAPTSAINVSTDAANAYGLESKTSGAGADGVWASAGGSGAHGCLGEITGTSLSENNTYGGIFTRTNLGTWGDVAESSDTPLAASPPAGYVRIIAGADGRLYAFDSSGNRHDLNERTPHYFAGWIAAQNATKAKTWDSDAYNSGLGSEATVGAVNSANFDFTNQGALASYGSWSWNPTCSADLGGGVFLYSQSQVAVWTPFDRQGDLNDNCRVYVQARVRVSAVADFENVYLFLNDVTTADAYANKALSADQLASMSDNTWYIATLATAGTDVGAWNQTLRAGVLAQGKLYATETDSVKATVDIDWIKVYQFAN